VTLDGPDRVCVSPMMARGGRAKRGQAFPAPGLEGPDACRLGLAGC
jgi:hypothetical protein